MANGATKTAKEWKSYWHELKYRARKRDSEIRQNARRNRPAKKPVTGTDARILQLLRSLYPPLDAGTTQGLSPGPHEKQDNQLKTGPGEGTTYQCEDGREIMFKIIGKDPPAIHEMNIPEFFGSEETPAASPSAESACTSGSDSSNYERLTKKSRYRRRLRRSVDYDKELIKLKKQKLAGEILLTREQSEIAKRERYKLDLELLKLEKELQIEPSDFTIPYISHDERILGDNL